MRRVVLICLVTPMLAGCMDPGAPASASCDSEGPGPSEAGEWTENHELGGTSGVYVWHALLLPLPKECGAGSMSITIQGHPPQGHSLKKANLLLVYAFLIDGESPKYSSRTLLAGWQEYAWHWQGEQTSFVRSNGEYVVAPSVQPGAPGLPGAGGSSVMRFPYPDLYEPRSLEIWAAFATDERELAVPAALNVTVETPGGLIHPAGGGLVDGAAAGVRSLWTGDHDGNEVTVGTGATTVTSARSMDFDFATRDHAWWYWEAGYGAQGSIRVSWENDESSASYEATGQTPTRIGDEGLNREGVSWNVSADVHGHGTATKSDPFSAEPYFILWYADVPVPQMFAKDDLP